MFKNGGGSPFTITFVGEVLQGSLINALPSGYSIRSSMVPQAGRITADLGLPAQAGDQAFIFKSHGTYAAYTYDDIAGDWDTPGGPVVQVGQSFFYRNASAPRLWIRNFTVN